jgi:hypothetical protein
VSLGDLAGAGMDRWMAIGYAVAGLLCFVLLFDRFFVEQLAEILEVRTVQRLRRVNSPPERQNHQPH